MQKLKLGTVHLTLPSSTMSTLIPKFGLFEMPFLIKDRNHLLEIEREIYEGEICVADEYGYGNFNYLWSYIEAESDLDGNWFSYYLDLNFCPGEGEFFSFEEIPSGITITDFDSLCWYESYIN